MANNTLITVSGKVPSNIETQVASGMRPRADYLEIARSLSADILDHAAARAASGRVGWILGKIGGANLVMAYACWILRKQYKTILTDGEQVGLPLAAFLKFSGASYPRHLMIVHVLSAPKKILFLSWLRVHTHIDRFLVYSTAQKEFIKGRWSILDDRITKLPFMVDDKFFSPDRVRAVPKSRPQICSVGLERRDYPTLLRAVKGLDIDVVIAAASPWSKYKDSSLGLKLPTNVTRRKYSQYELRQLYADSDFVVMPLEPVDFQAGITSILEAMAMGKAVICSAAVGQTDAIIDGKNGNYVPVGNASELREAIVELLMRPAKATQLGAAGRDRIEEEMNLEHYVINLKESIDDLINVGR